MRTTKGPRTFFHMEKGNKEKGLQRCEKGSEIYNHFVIERG